MDRGAWWATVHEVAKGQTQLSDSYTHTHTHTHTHTLKNAVSGARGLGRSSLPSIFSLAVLLGPTVAKFAIVKQQ